MKPFRITLFGCILFAVSLTAQSEVTGVVGFVRTERGFVRGQTDGGVDKFLGIPFAAPPVGELRWKAPVEPAKWTGVLDATKLASSCTQLSRGAAGNQRVEGSEDCLYLNVYRPTRPGIGRPRPVIVFIHGGSNQRGSGAEYDPSEMVAKTGVVVVTVNYRLNVLGFLAPPSLDAEAGEPTSGNFGFQDQQAALRWVRSNIRAFGGDPSNVTVEGESAGGIDICAHLVAPSSAGLFDKAIIESSYCPASSHDDALAVSAPVAEALSCSDADCLRSKAAEELIKAVPLSPVPGGGKGFNAIPNFGNSLLPVLPAEALSSGQWNKMPVLMGSNHDEMALFAGPMLLAAKVPMPMTAQTYQVIVAAQFGPFAPQVLKEYPVANFPSPLLAYSDVLTDYSPLGCAVTPMALSFAGHAMVFRYEFNDQAAPFGRAGLVSGLSLGAYHGAELQYLFKMTRLPGPATEAQKQLSDQMIRYWTNFAKTGDPNGEGLTYWPVYDGDARQMMSLHPDGNAVLTNFDVDHHCAFWAAAPGPPFQHATKP
ncbi:carboxylesterase family protein [uncultured Paludibaculum sp.]|uniref:carboxylesterase/lipase family protein n=1 Tax=uncultured Paludibaculum sp. TaxID=1765020 RepID=UPI002AAC3305|nr:carboxylesterase family protein [uncultured Paludibaculum sp.]